VFDVKYLMKFHLAIRITAYHPVSARRSLSELLITEMELKLIAAAAIIGLSNRPNAG
jgi:hypothetical protein